MTRSARKLELTNPTLMRCSQKQFCKTGFCLGKIFFLLLACLPAFAPCLVFQARAQGDRALEYQVKAAFLYNFVKFVDWPPDVSKPNSPITIGILGEDPFGDKLDAMIKGKSVDGRELVIKRHLDGPQEWNACHVLFISASERKRLPQILETTRKKS